jgi:hypothetical protein
MAVSAGAVASAVLSGKSVIKSRWRFLKCAGRTDSFLRTLGIEFRTGDFFWKDNALILPELYEQMQEAARERLHELHPDKNGDAAEFRAFIAAYTLAKRAFARYLPQGPDRVIDDFAPDKPCLVGRGRRGLGIYKSEKVVLGSHILKERGVGETAQLAGLSRGTVKKIRRALLNLGFVLKRQQRKRIRAGNVADRFCENKDCGARLVGKVYPSGKREALVMFSRRRFCNPQCAYAHRGAARSERFCENPACRSKLVRRRSARRRESWSSFLNRRFCGYLCSNFVTHGKRTSLRAAA